MGKGGRMNAIPKTRNSAGVLNILGIVTVSKQQAACGRSTIQETKRLETIAARQYTRKITFMIMTLGTEQLVRCSLFRSALPKDGRLIDAARHLGVTALGSIKARPVKLKKGQLYEVIQGVRYWQAALYAGIMDLSVEVHDYSDATAAILLSMEEDSTAPLLRHAKSAAHDAITRAEQICARADDVPCSLAAAGREIGLSRVATSKLVRLLRLPSRIQSAVRMGEIPASVAGLWVGLSHERCMQAYRFYTRSRPRPSMHAVERWLRVNEPAAESWARRDAQRLSRHFGCPVTIRVDAGGAGEVTFRYFNTDSLTGLYERWGYDVDSGDV